MKQLRPAFLVVVLLVSLTTYAQTEVSEQISLSKGNELSSTNLKQSLHNDSLLIGNDIPGSKFMGIDVAELYTPTPKYTIPTNVSTEFRYCEPPKSQLLYNRSLDFSLPSFNLWRYANLSFYGNINQRPGLMDVASGAATYHQNIGKWQLSASMIAHKYWMPMQKQLVTQYGIGGTLSYQLNNDISLHAYGYYYNNNPIVGPAYSPYVNTSSYGGYANIRFSDCFSTDVGVNRYVNPMTGRWTTSPIVTPHLRVGRVDIGLPVGEFLKAAFGGDVDNPIRYREPQKRQSKKRK